MKYLKKTQENTALHVQAKSKKGGLQLDDHRATSVLQQKQVEALMNQKTGAPTQQNNLVQFNKSKKQRELDKAAKVQKAEERKANKSEVGETYKVASVKKPKKVKEIEVLNLAEARKEFNVNARMAHIWNRHSPSSKKPGKSLFPVGWDQNKAANAIVQVIVDASKYSESAKYGKSIQGYFEGVLIEVYFMPSSVEDEFEVSTAYPVKGKEGIITNSGNDEDDA